MPQTSVPNDALMKTQQAKDSPAKKRTKSKSTRKAAPKANFAARTGKPKTKPLKAAPAPAAPRRGTAKPVSASPNPASATSKPEAAAPKKETVSGWSFGRLFSFFSRSRSEKALEKAADSSLGKDK